MNKLIIALGALALSALAAMAGIDELPVKTVDGRSYHYYEVQPKETIYSLLRRFGITREQLTAENPSVATDGLKAGQVLLFAVDGVSSPVGQTHRVARGETIYGICHQYNITPEQLEAWNPNVREGLKSGMTIFVTAPATTTAQTTTAQATIQTTVQPTAAPVASKEVSEEKADTGAPAQQDGYILYTVKERETFYSIARSHKISVARLEEANPGTGILKAGQTLRIPVAEKQTPVVADSDKAIEISVPGADKQLAETPAAVEKKSIDIALILPFSAGTTPQPRQGQLYTEFYKGFLLAVDSMRHCGTPIHVSAYDTYGSADSLTSILANPNLKSVQLIIAPESEPQLEQVARFANANGISVLNLFAIRDRSYLRYPNVYQANIPHNAMYEKAVRAIVNDLGSRKPVIIAPADAPADKREFIQALKSALDGVAIPYETITYETALSVDDLAKLDRNGKFAFIPTSGKQADLNRMLPALLELKQEMTDYDPVKLYGYPEWTTFRGETLENMHAMNTYVYSRFFTVPDDPAAADVQEAFVRWYGLPMASYVPRQGLLGFDTAMYLIGALRANDPVDNYTGAQNGYHFIRPAGVAGYVNDDLYFVNFRPSGLIDRINL